jgi:hypothetical protein
VPDDVVLPPRQALVEAQRLLDEGLPFHAHEILEGVWKNAPDGERDLWQGMAQLAVGLTHLLRGNPAGAAAVLRRGQARIAPYEAHPPHDRCSRTSRLDTGGAGCGGGNARWPLTGPLAAAAPARRFEQVASSLSPVRRWASLFAASSPRKSSRSPSRSGWSSSSSCWSCSRCRPRRRDRARLVPPLGRVRVRPGPGGRAGQTGAARRSPRPEGSPNARVS